MNRLMMLQDEVLLNESFKREDIDSKYDCVVIGDDLLSVILAVQLQVKNSLKSIKFIHQKSFREHYRDYPYHHLCRDFPQTFSLSNIEENSKLWKSFQEKSRDLYLPDNCFQLGYFKDQKIKEFSRNDKKYPLKPLERYYTHAPILFDYFKYLSFDVSEHVVQLMDSPPSWIAKIEYQDQVEDNYYWKIYLQDGTILITKNMMYSPGVLSFLKFCSTSLFSRVLKQYAFSIKYPPYFLWTLWTSKPLVEKNMTLFIPQYVGRDEGHFISQHLFTDKHNGHTTITNICFFEDEDDCSESVHKKLSLLKRWFKKIFPHYERYVIRESFCIEQEIPMIKEEWAKEKEKLKNEFELWEKKGLYFTGGSAPTDVFLEKPQETNFVQNALYRYTQLETTD